jgi:hypothetical protein
LDQLSTFDNTSFGNILSVLSTYDVSKCSLYSYSARTNFTKYATQYLLNKFNKSTLNGSDLDLLGPCFAPTIPVDLFSSMNESDFIQKSNYFKGIQFQPDSVWITKLGEKIRSISINNNNNQTYLFSNLGELMVFSPNLDQIDQTTFAKFGRTINNAIKNSKNTDNPNVQLARVGANDDSALENVITNWQTSYINYMLVNGLTSRRSRAIGK